MLSTQGIFGQPQMAEALLEGLTHLRLAGPLTAVTSSGARRTLRESGHRSEFRLLVDLQDVTALDASGRRAIEGHAQGVMLLRANGLVIRALKQTGTLGVFDFCTG